MKKSFLLLFAIALMLTSCREKDLDMSVLNKSLFHIQVTDFVSPSIVVKQTVETNALYAGNESSQRDIGL